MQKVTTGNYLVWTRVTSSVVKYHFASLACIVSFEEKKVIETEISSLINSTKNRVDYVSFRFFLLARVPL